MTSQSAPIGGRPSGEIIGVFDNRQEALQAREAIASSGIPTQQVLIDNARASSALSQADQKARGTTTGGKAGLLVGGFYGGVLGIIASVIVPFWVQGIEFNSTANRLLLLALTIAGAVIGYISGNQTLAAQKQEQKENPSAPTAFRLLINGSEDEIAQARRVLNETAA
jgi:hypothetical protein